MPACLQPHPPNQNGDRLELAATLTIDGQSQRLWWRVPARCREWLTDFADPFVVGFAFQMMKAGQDIEVRGPVSKSLLANLQDFMDVWAMWVPGVYRRARIWSHEEAELPTPLEPDVTIMPFSAGVDSCFTAFQHARDLAGRNTRRVPVGVTMYGFDILDREPNAAAMYAQVRDASTNMLQSLGMDHVEISTNFRDLGTVWAHSFGTQLASGLSLFSRRFSGALIPNNVLYNQLATVWGSHPLTDRMLGSDKFRLSDDGGGVPRWKKIEVISQWPEAMAGLRVCFGAAGNVGNCGRCEKCIRTAVGFKLTGAIPPAGLPNEVTPRMFRTVRPKQPVILGFWNDLDDGIRERGKESEPWAAGVRSVLRRAKRIALSKSIKQPFVPLRNRIRAIFRGSTQSKRQIETASKSS